MAIELNEHQRKAVEKMHNGCILCGGVGSGKSRTALYYYFTQNEGCFDENGYRPMKDPPDLYIITTAKKRDTLEWDGELVPFLMSRDPEINIYSNQIVIDSWNNIQKYANVHGAYFIFDEQRVVGKGAWVKAFLKIAKWNQWILLSATPGDTWTDYIPVFLANGFYKNITQFRNEHIVYSRFTSYPKVDRYLNTGRLVRLRNKILVDMNDDRKTIRHDIDVWCNYDVIRYKEMTKRRWDPYNEEPIVDAGGLCRVQRRIVNCDPNRQVKLLDIFEDKGRIIVFYNFDYELEILKELFNGYGKSDSSYSELHVRPKHSTDRGTSFEIAEWNGHKHQEIPSTDRWVYLVQYNAGCEGWNCIKTDTIVFYSQTYSYKVLEQARGRIDRINTPFTDLYYYHLRSRSSIDLAILKALRSKKNFNERRFYEGYNK